MSYRTDLRTVTLAILAGGAGTRMGKPKAWLEIKGVPILRRIHETLQWPGPTQVVTVAHRRSAPGFDLFHREVIDAKEEGPLRGVFTALENTTTDLNLIIPVDMPHLQQSHLQWMADHLQGRPDLLGMMLRREEIEPLPFCCRRGAAPIIAKQLETAHHALRQLAAQPGFAAIAAPRDWPADLWRNLNSPGDL